MHAPKGNKKDSNSKSNPTWEAKIKELQTSCYQQKREAPKKLKCCVENCEAVWEGKMCWDERMEHVGKHLDKSAGMSGVNKLVVDQGSDMLLVSWGLKEGIIEENPDPEVGGYRLVVTNSRSSTVADGYEDAEGEDEE